MITPMDRLEIVCLRSIFDEVTDFVHGWGKLHMEDVSLAVENAPGFLHKLHITEAEAAEMELLERTMRMLDEVVGLLPSVPSREDVASSVAALAEDGSQKLARRARRLGRDLRSLTRRKMNVKDNLEVVNNSCRFFETFVHIVGDTPVMLGKTARAMVLSETHPNETARLKRRFEQVLGPRSRFYFHKFSRDKGVALVTYPEESNATAARVMADEGIAPVDTLMQSNEGLSLQEWIDQLKSTVLDYKKDMDGIQADMDRFAEENGPELKAIQLLVSDRLASIQVRHFFAASEMVVVMHGWAPADSVQQLRDGLEQRFGDRAVVGILPQDQIEPENVPTLLSNVTPTQPFEVLLSLFKPPTYGTFDPSLMVGVFFVLFYGFILGDLGYGIVIMALAWVARRRWSHIQPVVAASTIAIYCSISAMVFGLLFGEFFGEFGHRLGMPRLWFNRGDEAQKLLIIALAAGAVHVTLSLLISIREHMRHRNRKHAGESLGLLLGLLSVGVGALSYAGIDPFASGPVRIAAAFCLIASVTILVAVSRAMAAVHMLEVVSLVGNVLSYSRLMALGIASVVLADVANSMVGKTGNIIVGIVFAIIIHCTNIVMGIFSPTLHSLRLNYVEFLPKFYSPRGKLYKPFRKETVL